MAVSLIDSNTINAYTGSFQILAFSSMWRRFRAESAVVRLVPVRLATEWPFVSQTAYAGPLAGAPAVSGTKPARHQALD